MKSPFKRILITAALPYANGYLHLGHLAGAYLPADIYARYQRMKNAMCSSFAAPMNMVSPLPFQRKKKKTTPKNIIDRYHPANKAAFEAFEMSFDNYSRTSLPLHHETAKDFFREFHKRSIVIDKKEQQLYCLKRCHVSCRPLC